MFPSVRRGAGSPPTATLVRRWTGLLVALVILVVLVVNLTSTTKRASTHVIRHHDRGR